MRLEPRTIGGPFEADNVSARTRTAPPGAFPERYRPCRIDPTLSPGQIKLLEAAGAAAEGLRLMLAAV